MYDFYLKERNCKSLFQKITRYFHDNNKEKNFTLKDELLGEIECNFEIYYINIIFISERTNVKIFTDPIILQREGLNIEIYTKEALTKILSDNEDKYLFYCNNQYSNSEWILENEPKLVILIKKETISFEFFKELSEKGKLPQNEEDNINIETSKLIPKDIYTLNLKRNDKFDMIIKDRYKLINIIYEFLNSKFKILKIYGVDGIGKSISFIYFSYLQNDYKVIYFNLKEFSQKDYLEKCSFIIHQLLNYFSPPNKKENDINATERTKIFYGNFIDKIQEIQSEINKHKEINIWIILANLIRSYFFRDNTLFIFDQYKSENDKENKLGDLERLLAFDYTNNNIKFIISSSINDSSVKLDFLMDIHTLSELYRNKNENNSKNNNDDQKLKYVNSKNFIINKNLIENEIIQIIYINKLVSAKYLSDENKNQVEKMADFDFNPKYFYKFKKYCSSNSSLSIDESIIYFNKKIYESMSTKIKKYYIDFAKKLDNDSFHIFNYISQVENNIINKGYALTLEELKQNLDIIPLKYFKILLVDEKNNTMDNNIINMNKNIVNYKFKLDYSFPFIKFLFKRLIFDLEKVDLKNLSPGGAGTYLENLILKAIFTHKAYGNFNYRILYSFKNYDKTKIKIADEDKEPIDIFNFKKLNYDDIKTNLLIDLLNYYYIVPKKTNNESLDSLILISSSNLNQIDQEFYLISLQITINKTGNKLKCPMDYCNATIEAAKLLETIYKIKIKNKYFLFVLLKEYNNADTQTSLIRLKIPYIFFSSKENKFYTTDMKEISNLQNLLNDKYLIIENPIERESVFYKSCDFNDFKCLLNRKRPIKKLNNDIYYDERKNKFPNDEPIIFTESISNKINSTIKKILNEKYTNNYDFDIYYAFISPFFNINDLNNQKNLFGIIFFKSNIFIYYQGNLSGFNINDFKENIFVMNELETFINKDLNNIRLIEDKYGATYNKEKKYEKIVQISKKKPCSIYVYYFEQKSN